MRLNPLDPLISIPLSGTAFAHFYAGRYGEARSWAERALQENPNSYSALRMSAASNALLGRMEDARKAMARLRQIDPALRVADLDKCGPRRRPEDSARLTQLREGLRVAGLPE
jgi:adenylate cyclase